MPSGSPRLSADLLYGSGLRRDGEVPNGAKLPAYTQLNLGASQEIGAGVTVRADVINVFDKVYEIRDGTGVGVGAPQYGPRRGLFVGAEQDLLASARLQERSEGA